MTAYDPAFYPEYVYCYKVVDNSFKVPDDQNNFTYCFSPEKLFYN